ncbi:MAG: hypothetical protein EXS35_10060 [Pedosphaera sp.]|nr:hypothetical protein [Pedosphaera sp.]
MNEPASEPAKPPRSRRSKLRIAVIIIAVVVVSTWLWLRMTYPYGSHRVCAESVSSALTNFATLHDGWFPHGGASPEASLSLLGRDDTNAQRHLCGKQLPLSVTQTAWATDGHLGPESCGWNYVEGLRRGDDQTIAVVWDKVFGIDHFGQRRRGLAHEVIFLAGNNWAVSMEEWPKFAMEQREKIAKVIATRPTNSPPIRWSDEVTLGTNWFPAAK